MAAPDLGFFGQQFMIWVLILIPGYGIAAYFRVRAKKPLPAKQIRYRRAIAGQVVLLLVIALAAWEQRVPLIAGPFPGPTSWLLAAGFLTIMGFRLRQAWPKLTPERLERARILLPEHPSNMRMWVVISAMAGITEECAYRGLAMKFLTANHGSYWLALTLCVVAFAIAHAVQGWRGILATAVIAILLHAVVYATQSLYLAIVVHSAYDLMVGIIAMPFLREFAARQEMATAAGQ